MKLFSAHVTYDVDSHWLTMLSLHFCGAYVYSVRIILSLYRWNEAFRSSLVNSRVETNKQLVEAIVGAKYRPKVWVSTSAIGKFFM